MRPSARSVAFVALAGSLALLSLGCPKSAPPAPDASASASDATTTTPSGDAAASAEGGNDENVEPVYPIEAHAPPIPLAEKLCRALTTITETKRAACCNTKASLTVTDECTRQLSAALRHNALSLEEKAVDACIAGFDKDFAGCDWVGPFAPGPPAACQGIFTGKLAAGQKCRSSLECAGDLRCRELGPTSPGKCGPAGSNEESCGGTVDSLATYARQDDVDKRHPECKERCIKHKCQAAVAENGPCLITSDCQDGMQCLPSGAPAVRVGLIPKKCVAGKVPGKDGEVCPGGVCEGTLQCVHGKCANRKPAGEACTDDFECRGGCLKPDGGVSSGDGGTRGTCGPRCDIR
jgi:hypothetical protein